MENENHGRKSHSRSLEKQCEQAKRLMRVSTTSQPREDFCGNSGDQLERTAPYPDEVSNKRNKGKLRRKEENADLDDEYMLQNLHKLKRFLHRVWKFAWCYTQYCYPALRTVEYYKKVKQACKEKEKVKKEKKKKNEKENIGDLEKKKTKNRNDNVNFSVAPLFLESLSNVQLKCDHSTQTSDEDEWPDEDKLKDMDSVGDPLQKLPDSVTGWSGYLLKHCHVVSSSFMRFMTVGGNCNWIISAINMSSLVLVPAVMWLGYKNICLKTKYKTLSRRLRRIKEENVSLKKECSKLESMMSTTEKLKMPFSTRESRHQVVAEFTRLAESQINFKKEITRLRTEKQALLEELKTAKRHRDMAEDQYRSITQHDLKKTDLQYSHI